jgi:hypothetical protein
MRREYDASAAALNSRLVVLCAKCDPGKARQLAEQSRVCSVGRAEREESGERDEELQHGTGLHDGLHWH